MKDKILLSLCHMGGKEMDYIKEAFDDNWIVPLGPNVNGFEKDLERFIIQGNTDHVIYQDKLLKISTGHEEFSQKRIIALSAGTAAIHLGLVELGIKSGDEVIVQSFTFSASANPVVYQGANPIFVDSERDTWNISPSLLEFAIEDRIAKTGKKPAAIIPVYLYGMPAKIDEILRIACKWDIPVLEDAAEAFGSRYKNQMCGTFGRYGALSFNGNKMITTSGGGALICPGEEEAKSVLSYATQSREPAPWYQHERIGYNYRMSNICAGIGRGQMEIADQHLAHHRFVHQRYKELFTCIEGITLQENPNADYDSNYWLSAIIFSEKIKARNDDGCGVPEAMRRYLNENGVESRQLWKPMHLQPFFKDAPAYIDGTSEHLFNHGLCLPSGPLVKEKDIEFIVNTIKDNIKF